MLNADTFFSYEDKEVTFTKSLYKFLDIKYPKFYKMDILSKYGFLASEILISNSKTLKYYKDDEVALLFANSNSSTLTDLKYQNTISEKQVSPSPALFVYTLPNILLGEIAIRNKWYGENMFFVLEEFDIKFLTLYAETLLSSNHVKACILAWVDIKNDNTDVMLLSIEKTSEGIDFNQENLKNLYN